MALSKQPDTFLWQHQKVRINDQNRSMLTHKLASWIPISTGIFQRWEKPKMGSIQGNIVYKINAKVTFHVKIT